MGLAPWNKRRAFGQHFLRDKGIATEIARRGIEEAAKYGCRACLEIGPGKGAITYPILEALRDERAHAASKGSAFPVEELILAEKDPELVNWWKTRQLRAEAEEMPLPPDLGFRIEAGDFLDLENSRYLAKTPVAVISNLPYSAGTAIVQKLARQRESIPVMVLMFQAEVAQRLRAEVGSKDWGSLSLWIQNRWDVAKVVHVPPRAFQPPPKVDSEVVILTRRDSERIAIPNTPRGEKLWEQLLKAGFAHRRKMLRSGLPATGNWRNALERAGLDATKRAESLQWDEWKAFYQALLDLEGGPNGISPNGTPSDSKIES